MNSYDERINQLCDRLDSLEELIYDGSMYGDDGEEGLEANVEPPISEDVDYIGDKPDILTLEELVELTDCRCEEATEDIDRVDAVLNRFRKVMGDYPGKSIDDGPIVCGYDFRSTQCGKPSESCRSCSAAMWMATRFTSSTHEDYKPCKYEVLAYEEEQQ